MSDLDEYPETPAAARTRADLHRRAAAMGLRLITIEITHAPIPDPKIEALASAERDRIQTLTHRMYEDPASLRDELEELVSRHPDIAMLRNHLAGALSVAGEMNRAREVVADLVRLFPNYVFGLCNHVMMLLADGNVGDARGLVETGPRGPLLHISYFDPARSVFHETEVIAYSAMVGHYLIETDRRDAAKVHLKLLKEIAPGHPQTKRLAGRMKESALIEDLKNASMSVAAPRKTRKSAARQAVSTRAKQASGRVGRIAGEGD